MTGSAAQVGLASSGFVVPPQEGARMAELWIARSLKSAYREAIGDDVPDELATLLARFPIGG